MKSQNICHGRKREKKLPYKIENVSLKSCLKKMTKTQIPNVYNRHVVVINKIVYLYIQ
jgi:hypothetical protein